MAECAQGESVVVDVAGVTQHPGDKIAGSDVVKQIGEFMIAEWVIAEVLNRRTPVGVGVGLLDLIGIGLGEALEEGGADVGIPSNVDQFLMREDAITEKWWSGQDRSKE